MTVSPYKDVINKIGCDQYQESSSKIYICPHNYATIHKIHKIKEVVQKSELLKGSLQNGFFLVKLLKEDFERDLSYKSKEAGTD